MSGRPIPGATPLPAAFGIVGAMMPDEIRARIAMRPTDEPLDDSVAHAAYWALVELQEAGGTSPEKAALLRDFAAVKADLIAALAEVET